MIFILQLRNNNNFVYNFDFLEYINSVFYDFLSGELEKLLWNDITKAFSISTSENNSNVFIHIFLYSTFLIG